MSSEKVNDLKNIELSVRCLGSISDLMSMLITSSSTLDYGCTMQTLISQLAFCTEAFMYWYYCLKLKNSQKKYLKNTEGFKQKILFNFLSENKKNGEHV